MTPSVVPTLSPSLGPSVAPTVTPTLLPSITPTLSPSITLTLLPSIIPTLSPSITPSVVPTLSPSLGPSVSSTISPTLSPSITPSVLPTLSPTSLEPTILPSFSVTTEGPTEPSLTESPTLSPSLSPTSLTPSLIPTFSTTSLLPTISPSFPRTTEIPTIRTELKVPTSDPSIAPTLQPSATPTGSTAEPVPQPDTNEPTLISTTANPTKETNPPTDQPTVTATNPKPTLRPTPNPSTRPNTEAPTSKNATASPTAKPLEIQTNTPTNNQSEQPTFFPTVQPSSIALTTGKPSPSPSSKISPLTKPPTPPKVPPISPAPSYKAFGLICLQGDESSVSILEQSTSSTSINLFSPSGTGVKSGKAGSKSSKGKSGKGSKSLKSECYSTAGPYRTCFQRSNTLNTCDTIVGERPKVGSDEVLLEGTMHLALLQEYSTVTCEKEIQLERALLTYLADNIGSESTFEPVCVYSVDSAQSKQLVPNSVGQYVSSTAIEMQIHFIQKKGTRKLPTNADHDERHLQSNECTITDRALCCSQLAINGFVAENCASLGCSLNKCGSGRRPRKSPRKLSRALDFGQTQIVERRTGKSGKGAKASFFHGKSAKADYHAVLGPQPVPINTCPWYGMLYEQEFNDVVRKYTLFNPAMTRSLVGVENTSSVAICGANRFSIDEYATPTLRCDVFIQEQCPRNEDLPSDMDIATPHPVAPPPFPAPTTRSPISPPVPKPTNLPITPGLSEPPMATLLPPMGNVMPTLPPGISNPPALSSIPPQSNVIPTLPPGLGSGPPVVGLTPPPVVVGLPTLPPNSLVLPPNLLTLPPNSLTFLQNSSPPPIGTVFTPAPSTSTLTSSPWDFESGVFPERPWRTGGNGAWAIDSTKVDNGLYSIKSPDLASTNIPGPLVSNATLTLAADFGGGLVSARVLASVAPPIDVFVIYVDGVSAAQLTDSQEFSDVIFSLEPGPHRIDFSYQYNIFGVDPLPPSPENRLGAVWIDSVSLEPLPQRNFRVFRYFFKDSESEKISMSLATLDASGCIQSKHRAGFIPSFLILGLTLLNRL
ncbi:hypothetical protein ACHAW6_013516 [Cyclotella cf. meneghiniana]